MALHVQVIKKTPPICLFFHLQNAIRFFPKICEKNFRFFQIIFQKKEAAAGIKSKVIERIPLFV